MSIAPVSKCAVCLALHLNEKSIVFMRLFDGMAGKTLTKAASSDAVQSSVANIAYGYFGQGGSQNSSGRHLSTSEDIRR